MVDSADLGRIDQEEDSAKAELFKVIGEPILREAPLLVLANKQDLKGAMPVNELKGRLGLTSMKRPWFIQSTVATKAEGLYEGLDWLAQTLSDRTY